MGKKKPRHNEHNAKGSEENPFGQRPSKADLLARMKATASKKKQGEPVER